MPLSLIVAMTRSGVIGRGGQLPWRLSADLRRFKALTMGHCLIMGRKTFDSLGRVLPGRTSIVLTRQDDFQPPAGVMVARNLDEALALAASDNEPFVIGGGEIFSLALPRADRLYITWVHGDIAGDTYFPELDVKSWKLLSESHHPADEKNEYPTTFSTYERQPI